MVDGSSLGFDKLNFIRVQVSLFVMSITFLPNFSALEEKNKRSDYITIYIFLSFNISFYTSLAKLVKAVAFEAIDYRFNSGRM
jgi:hypothetical protein